MHSCVEHTLHDTFLLIITTVGFECPAQFVPVEMTQTGTLNEC
jgi:hypothetical protein